MMSDVVGWAFYIALVVGCLSAIWWTTFVAHRYGRDRMHLGDTALSCWTLVAFLGLFIGLWIPAIAFLAARTALRRASHAR